MINKKLENPITLTEVYTHEIVVRIEIERIDNSKYIANASIGYGKEKDGVVNLDFSSIRNYWIYTEDIITPRSFEEYAEHIKNEHNGREENKRLEEENRRLNEIKANERLLNEFRNVKD